MQRLTLSVRPYLCACALFAAGLVSTGCGSMMSKPEEKPATQPMATATPPAMNATSPEPVKPTMTPATEPAKPAMMALDPKDLTHVVSSDEPYFTMPPAAGVAPAGILKTGMKVKVDVPSLPYSKLRLEDGTEAYANTEGLDPIMKK